jgi:hypothetical protein
VKYSGKRTLKNLAASEAMLKRIRANKRASPEQKALAERGLSLVQFVRTLEKKKFVMKASVAR